MALKKYIPRDKQDVKPPTAEQLDALAIRYRTQQHQAFHKQTKKGRAAKNKFVQVTPLLKLCHIEPSQWAVYCGLKGGHAAAVDSIRTRITNIERSEVQKTMMIVYKKVQDLTLSATINDLKALTEFISAMNKVNPDLMNISTHPDTARQNKEPANLSVDKLLARKHTPKLLDDDFDNEDLKQ